MTIHGFLNINKPAGITSHDVVAQLRRATRQKRIGHGGTLDPAATGVLPIALGEATRLIDYLVDGRKGYRAVVHLGITTTTDDAEGDVIAQRPLPALDQITIERALRPFIGTIEQTPPIYSAIQVGGQRMYDLARRGQAIELAPRTVTIDQIDLIDWQPPYLMLDIICGKGTYIRSIARDLGALLGCGAHLAALQRTRVGSLLIADAVPLQTLLDAPDQIAQRLLPPAAAVADVPCVTVDDATAKRIRNGLPIDLPHASGDMIRVHDTSDRLVALLRAENDRWQPFKVFAWA